MVYEHTLNDIKWEEIDARYQYASQDHDGSIWVWGRPPHLRDKWWMPAAYYPHNSFIKIKDQFSAGGDFPTWRDALISRPVAPVVKAPDGHPHAALMAEYAKDATNNKEPWKLWEYKTPGVHSLWLGLRKNPEWDESIEYRRKIKTVTITIPESLAVEFVTLRHLPHASMNLSVAIQDALNKEQE